MKIPKDWLNQDKVNLVPVQREWDETNHKDLPDSSIPHWLAEIAYTEYVKHGGRGQSLERLNERGGFGRWELLFFLRKALNEANIDYK